ncbi:MAG TPA: OB-fold domain-containing protein [Streptosporangiaceae bacterium]|nr:OB-fold domain-containing protein [Streptosporangiaceae bacterium]
MSEDLIREAAARIAAAGDNAPRAARDPVNLPMIRTWIEAIDPGGPEDPDTAPPSMIQVWTMPGLRGTRAGDDPLGLINQVLDEAGFTSVVATNCDQVYRRYLKPGEQLTVRGRLLDVTGPKRTALGEGWFVTTRSTWFSAGEPVATMDFRILKFRPSPPATAPASPAVSPLRPLVTPDTAFFWAGTAAGELRIQRCSGCGTLRHPPGPMCPACGQPGDGGYVVAAGTGEVFSYVVHHHPPVPGKTLPMVVALVQLPEGVRMVGEMPGTRPDLVRIGLPVRVAFARLDDDLTLPAWRPAEGMLPDRVIDVTPTFVISSALATRDFYEVHHDRDLAVTRGSADIFINILTTTGLVERYVSAWAPDAVVRAVSIRLGVPCHAGETLTLSGQALDDEVIAVTGRCSLGDHVTATVRIAR